MANPTRRRPARSAPLLDRGVYRPDCLSPEGLPYLFAVSRHGCKVVPDRTVYPFEDADEVLAEVWDALNSADPPAS